MNDPDLEMTATPSRGALRRMRGVVKRAVTAAVRKAREQANRLSRKKGRRQTGVAHVLEDADLLHHWERLATRMLALGGASSGNRVKLFCDGDEALEEIWRAIDEARQRIWFETYILEPDRVGNLTIEALTRAAQRRCKITLLYDSVGSPRAGEALLRPLRQAGGEVEAFNPVWRWRRKAPLLRRDHRKIIIIDDHTGFCGGMNVSEDYAGPKYGNGRFHDCHMKVQGPCLTDLGRVFVSSLRSVRRVRRSLPRPKRSGNTFVQVLASSGVPSRRAIQRAMRLTVRSAARRCYITTPYFIPPRRLVRAINHAARRGIDVRILVAGNCDVPIVRAAAQHIYGAFLHRGVRIFEMFDCALHAKTMTIDGLYGTVGSFNLDTWSDKRNLEVNVAMIDAAVAGEIESRFTRNCEQATEVTLETWHKRSFLRRAIHWSAYHLMRL